MLPPLNEKLHYFDYETGFQTSDNQDNQPKITKSPIPSTDEDRGKRDSIKSEHKITDIAEADFIRRLSAAEFPTISRVYGTDIEISSASLNTADFKSLAGKKWKASTPLLIWLDKFIRGMANHGVKQDGPVYLQYHNGKLVIFGGVPSDAPPIIDEEIPCQDNFDQQEFDFETVNEKIADKLRKSPNLQELFSLINASMRRSINVNSISNSIFPTQRKEQEIMSYQALQGPDASFINNPFFQTISDLLIALKCKSKKGIVESLKALSTPDNISKTLVPISESTESQPKKFMEFGLEDEYADSLPTYGVYPTNVQRENPRKIVNAYNDLIGILNIVVEAYPL